MLTNKELQIISTANIMLLYLRQVATENADFTNKTGITTSAIDEIVNEFTHMHTKYALQKIHASERANAWNKAHPEQHRKHNNDYNKRKKGGK